MNHNERVSTREIESHHPNWKEYINLKNQWYKYISEY